MDYDKIGQNLKNRQNIKFGKSEQYVPAYDKNSAAYKQKKKNDNELLFWYVFRILMHIVSDIVIAVGVIWFLFDSFLGLNIISLGFFMLSLHLILPNRISKYYSNTPLAMIYMIPSVAAILLNRFVFLDKDKGNSFVLLIILFHLFAFLGMNMIYLGVGRNIKRLLYKRIKGVVVDASEVLSICPARVHYYSYTYNNTNYIGSDIYYEHWIEKGKETSLYISRKNPKKMLSSFPIIYTLGNTICGSIFIFIAIELISIILTYNI